jgi:hypothetical protein
MEATGQSRDDGEQADDNTGHGKVYNIKGIGDQGLGIREG